MLLHTAIFCCVCAVAFTAAANPLQPSANSVNGYHTPNDDTNYAIPYGQLEVINEEMRLFSLRAACREACLRHCKPIMLADTEQVFFICPHVKPPEKSIPEKLLTKMSLPLVLFLGLVGLVVFICCVCCCRALCCSCTQSHRSAYSSREGLHGKHIDALTADGDSPNGIEDVDTCRQNAYLAPRVSNC